MKRVKAKVLMRFKHRSFKVLRITLLFLVISSLSLNIEPLPSIMSAQSLGSFNYEFIINEEGFTLVGITYHSNRQYGSSWVFVPKFLEWTNHTIRGKVTEWSLRETENLTSSQYYFYEVLRFSFDSDGNEFEMNIQFNFSTAALIIEPNGIFYSPHIGFEKGNDLKAEVAFPFGFVINQGEAIAPERSYQPSYTNSNYALFDSIPETENSIRIAIGFKTLNQTPELLTIERGVFTFQTVQRYAYYARDILDLYDKTYDGLVNLFNVTLESAEVQFFLPDLRSLFTIGGYVPFSGEKMGDIHINIAFTRYVQGYIEVIALHELVHQFLWEAGLSPKTLLWFHEGMAEYVSLETANKIGYEGSGMMKQDLEDTVRQLRQTSGDDFGFLKEWTSSRQPRDVGILYATAYYVVSKLAEPYGGLEYYGRFFKLINGKKVDDNSMLGYHLSLAANESVVAMLNSWEFGISDLYTYSTLIEAAERALNEVNPIFQPYKFLAERLYRQVLLNAGKNDARTVQLYLVATILIARLAPLLTLITVSGIIFGAILLVLKKEGVL